MWRLGKLLTMFRKELLLAWAVLRDARTPWPARLAVVLAVLYVLSPVDLVSDFLPLLGWLDDGLVGLLLLRLALRFVPAELQAALRARVAARLDPAPGARR